LKRSIIVLLAASFAVFGISTTGSTTIKAAGTFTDGPYTATTPDSGCGSNNWAQDLFVRNFTAQLPAVGGVFTVTEKFQKGTFSTYDGDSPGNPCTNPGGHIKEGVTGKFSGFFIIEVSNGTFNPNGTCDKTVNTYPGWEQCDTAGWVKGFFGPSATYDIPKFKFVYIAKTGQGLIFSKWQNADASNGGNVGDISSS
jgi:hypothetical protein